MSGRIETVIEAVQGSLAADFSGRDETNQYFNQLPELFREIGKALTRTADSMAEAGQFNPKVTDMLREFAGTAGGLADTADDVLGSHHSGHSIWLND